MIVAKTMSVARYINFHRRPFQAFVSIANFNEKHGTNIPENEAFESAFQSALADARRVTDPHDYIQHQFNVEKMRAKYGKRSIGKLPGVLPGQGAKQPPEVLQQDIHESMVKQAERREKRKMERIKKIMKEQKEREDARNKEALGRDASNNLDNENGDESDSQLLQDVMRNQTQSKGSGNFLNFDVGFSGFKSMWNAVASYVTGSSSLDKEQVDYVSSYVTVVQKFNLRTDEEVDHFLTIDLSGISEEGAQELSKHQTNLANGSKYSKNEDVKDAIDEALSSYGIQLARVGEIFDTSSGIPDKDERRKIVEEMLKLFFKLMLSTY